MRISYFTHILIFVKSSSPRDLESVEGCGFCNFAVFTTREFARFLFLSLFRQISQGLPPEQSFLFPLEYMVSVSLFSLSFLSPVPQHDVVKVEK